MQVIQNKIEYTIEKVEGAREIHIEAEHELTFDEFGAMLAFSVTGLSRLGCSKENIINAIEKEDGLIGH